MDAEPKFVRKYDIVAFWDKTNGTNLAEILSKGIQYEITIRETRAQCLEEQCEKGKDFILGEAHNICALMQQEVTRANLELELDQTSLFKTDEEPLPPIDYVQVRKYYLATFASDGK
jgi:hypothetical protein